MKKLNALLNNRNFHLRIMSAVFLLPLGLFAVWTGGRTAILITALGAAVVYYEWAEFSHSSRKFLFFISLLLIATAALLLLLGAYEFAAIFFLMLAAVILFLHLVFRNVDSWRAFGLLYAIGFLVSLMLLRLSPALGFEAVLFLVLIVWATDSGAYFTGSLLGGKKLAPAISPKKTWAGFYGGSVFGVLAGTVAAYVMRLESWPFLILVSLFLSLAAQFGDLFESWLKRKFDIKDSSALIPGHGGMLDRLDSLVAAGVVAYCIGAARAGLVAPAAGLLTW